MSARRPTVGRITLVSVSMAALGLAAVTGCQGTSARSAGGSAGRTRPGGRLPATSTPKPATRTAGAQSPQQGRQVLPQPVHPVVACPANCVVSDAAQGLKVVVGPVAVFSENADPYDPQSHRHPGFVVPVQVTNIGSNIIGPWSPFSDPSTGIFDDQNNGRTPAVNGVAAPAVAAYCGQDGGPANQQVDYDGYELLPGQTMQFINHRNLCITFPMDLHAVPRIFQIDGVQVSLTPAH